MTNRPTSPIALEPRNRREACAWVRLFWQTYMRNADVPDLPANEWMNRVADVFCEESLKLADRLEPRHGSSQKKAQPDE